MFSEREKLLLQTLLNADTPLSIKDLSNSTKIKERTLYREIKNLESTLPDYNIKLGKEKSKYFLIGDKKNLDSSLFDSDFIDHAYSIDTRLNLVLCFLILQEDTSIKDISDKLMLSYNTVASTIATVENILHDYKLSLVRKKGQGIELRGNESDRRILLISILCNEINDEIFFSKLYKRETATNNPFIKFLNFDLLHDVFINNRELPLFTLYTDSSIKKILISLNVVLLRMAFETENKQAGNTDEHKLINNLLIATTNFITFDIRNDMINFLVKIVKTCRLIEQLSYFNDKYSYTLVYKINLLIKHVSTKMGVDFTQDTNLSSGLIAHVESAIKRYQMKLTETNEELLNFVLNNYNELYLVIKAELLTVFDEINFSSTELSYIVIHFASSYEQIYRKNFIRALVICSSGIGTSKILGGQLRKFVPEIKNIEYAIPNRITDSLLEEYDIVISTIELDIEHDYILIPTILQEADVTLIKEHILSSRSFKRKNTTNQIDTPTLSALLEASEDIKKQTFVTSLAYNDKIENMLVAIFEKVELEIPHKKQIIKNLIERNEKSSIVIPDTNLALFHTLDNTITKPFIIVCHLEKEISMKNANNVEEKVKTFFIMVSPNIEHYTNLLGQISIAILNDDILKQAINENHKEFIKTKLELILQNYIINNE